MVHWRSGTLCGLTVAACFMGGALASAHIAQQLGVPAHQSGVVLGGLLGMACGAGRGVFTMVHAKRAAARAAAEAEAKKKQAPDMSELTQKIRERILAHSAARRARGGKP